MSKELTRYELEREYKILILKGYPDLDSLLRVKRQLELDEDIEKSRRGSLIALCNRSVDRILHEFEEEILSH